MMNGQTADQSCFTFASSFCIHDSAFCISSSILHFFSSPSERVEDPRKQEVDEDEADDREDDGSGGGDADALGTAGHTETEVTRQNADERAEHAGLDQARCKIADV